MFRFNQVLCLALKVKECTVWKQFIYLGNLYQH